MSNPILNERALEAERVLTSEPMTVNGSINKTFILLGLLAIGSFANWSLFYQGAMDKVMALTTVGFIAAIVSFIIIMFNKNSLKYTAPIYAVSEGFLLGGVSAMIEQTYPGIAIQAIGLTIMAMFSMLVLYKGRVIKCTEKFRSTLLIATLSVLVIYLVNFIGSFFHMQIPYLFTSNSIGLGFSVVVVIIAALNLIIDFDFIERGSEALLSKNMEWYGAFGLMVTLVWLYIEILNLLAKMRDR